jgi:hypothetical protein
LCETAAMPTFFLRAFNKPQARWTLLNKFIFKIIFEAKNIKHDQSFIFFYLLSPPPGKPSNFRGEHKEVIEIGVLKIMHARSNGFNKQNGCQKCYLLFFKNFKWLKRISKIGLYDCC